MATRTSFFEQHSLPVFRFLSDGSRSAIEALLASGNQAHREQTVLAFFKSIDWLSLEELRGVGANPLNKLPASAQHQVYRDIETYLSNKARERRERSAQRKSHLLRVYEYFRQKVPREDKLLLERLRDYELEHTGRDTNWQHYFTMRTFRKIDAFIAMPPHEREALIARFKQDVATYQKNVQKWQSEPQAASWYDVFDMNLDELFGSAQHRRWQQNTQNREQQHRSPGSPPSSQTWKDLSMLGLPPQATLPDVKKQFRQLTLLHHPDVPGGCATRMKAIIAAYDRLKKILR